LIAIRLTRVGKKNQPYFRVVVQEKSAPVKGKFIEIIGSWNPRTGELVVDKEKLAAWKAKGAQLSATAAFLIEGKPKPEKPKKGPKKAVTEVAKVEEGEEVSEQAGEQVSKGEESGQGAAPEGSARRADERTSVQEKTKEEPKSSEESTPVDKSAEEAGAEVEPSAEKPADKVEPTENAAQ